MERTIKVEPSDAVPIWRQIEDRVRQLVAAGVLRPGDPVPSVRELARELTVNPATVAKAYQRMGDAGVLAVRRGEGTFVAERSPAALADERRELLADGATRYADLAIGVGASYQEASGELQRNWPPTDRSGEEVQDA